MEIGMEINKILCRTILGRFRIQLSLGQDLPTLKGVSNLHQNQALLCMSKAKMTIQTKRQW